MKSGLGDKKIVIIGAGPCGLGAAWRLHELGYDAYELYEKESYVGGLAASFKDKNGFTWDVGGHVLHSHYDYFDRMFECVLKGEYLTHQRESWIYLLERFIQYPFQNNIHRLPKAIRDECLEGLRKAASTRISDPKNFAQWITASFGAGVSKYFMYPYNYKVWAYPPELMNYQWVGDRVPKVDLKRIEQTIVTGQDDVSWGPNYVFKFPRRDGTGAIWNGVAKTFARHIHRNKRLVRVDTTQSRLYFDDGSDDSYDLLLSTLPLDVLVTLVGQKNTAAHKLHHSSVTIVGLGFAGAVPETFRTKCWIYFPDDITPFFRATVFSNYSPNNAPAGHWSLMTEVSSSVYRKLSKNIEQAVLDGAKSVGLLPTDSADPVDTWTFTSEYGYPTPTIGRNTLIDSALSGLAELHIFSRGRFGAWKYEVSNQDHTFMQGVEWVNRVVNGEEEITLFHPEIVNAKKL